MAKHRNPRASVSKRPTPDNRRTAPTEPAPAPAPEMPEVPEDDVLYALVCVLRDELRRADSYVTRPCLKIRVESVILRKLRQF